MTLFHKRTAWETADNKISGPKPKGTRRTWVIHYPGGGGGASGEATLTYTADMNRMYLRDRGYALGYCFVIGQDGFAVEARGMDYNNAGNAGKKVEGMNFNDVSVSIQIAVANDDAASPAAIAKANEIMATYGHGWDVMIHGDVDYTSCCGDGMIPQVRAGLFNSTGSATPTPEPTPPPTPKPPPEPLPDIDGYDPPHAWGPFPSDGAKPTVREGSTGQHVRYLQDVIFWLAGGNILVDGIFGSATARRVEDLQTVFGLTVDGWVGSQTWAAVDSIVSAHEEPVPPVDPPSTDVDSVSPVAWYITSGDSPWGVAVEVYGSGLEHDRLDAAAFSSFSTPAKAVFVDVPEIAGWRTQVQAGEGPYSILRRLQGRTGTNEELEVFYSWNGGFEREFHPGDVVHFPRG